MISYSSHEEAVMELKAGNLNDVREFLVHDLHKFDLVSAGHGWSLYKTLLHCAQTIEFSMSGYPKLKPLIIRRTVGRIVLKKFLKNNKMKHDLTAPVPGAAEIADEGNISEAVAVSVKTIDDFMSYSGQYKEHLLFGKLSKKEYDEYFTLHYADHFSDYQNMK